MASAASLPRKDNSDDPTNDGVWKNLPSFEDVSSLLPGADSGPLKTTLRRSFTTVKTTLHRIFLSSDRPSNLGAGLAPTALPTPPPLAPQPKPSSSKGGGDPELIRRHDIFNIACTGLIVAIVYSYMYIATEWDKVGCPF